MTLSELMSRVTYAPGAILPEAYYSMDNDGQIVIYTNLHVRPGSPNQELISFDSE